MARSFEQLLISSVLHEHDIHLAMQAGLTAPMFKAYTDEWQWLEQFFGRYHRTPGKLTFRHEFPDFRVLEAADTEHFASKVKHTYAKHLLMGSIDQVADYIANDDVERACNSLQKTVVQVAAQTGGNLDTDVFTNYQPILDEVSSRVARVDQAGMAGTPTGFDTLDERTGGLQGGWFCVIAARLGEKKALTDTTNVLTPTGWRPISQIVEGDKVIGSNGRATKVIGVFPQGVQQVVEVEFNDRTVIQCNEDHLWNVRIGTKPYKVQTTKQIAKHSGQRMAVPALSQPVHYAEHLHYGKNIYLPYQLGVLLGDGCFRGKSVTFSSTDTEIVQAMGPGVTTWSDGMTYHVSKSVQWIKGLGLWGLKSCDKFIPAKYLTARPADRLALLQGLLDTDGFVTSSGGVGLATTSPKLAQDVQQITESLGGYTQTRPRIARLKGKEHPYYWLTVILPPELPPFRLSRKLKQWIPRTKYLPARTIKEVRYTNQHEPMTCIAVEALDGLFVTEHHILTHNSWILCKMATEAIEAGKRVQYVSLEMTAAQVTYRIHNLQSAKYGAAVFEAQNLSRGQGFDLPSYSQFVKQMSTRMKNRLLIADSSRGRVSPLHIAAQIERNRPDIVFIDYITLMQKTGEGDWRSIGALSESLKGLAVQYDIPIVVAAQLNREHGLGKGPAGPEAIAQSDNIGQDADLVVTSKSLSPSVLQMMLAKFRHGAAGQRWHCIFRPQEARFEQVPYAVAMQARDEDDDARDAAST